MNNEFKEAYLNKAKAVLSGIRDILVKDEYKGFEKEVIALFNSPQGKHFEEFTPLIIPPKKVLEEVGVLEDQLKQKLLGHFDSQINKINKEIERLGDE